MLYTLEELKAIITPIAIRYGVESVSLFGSYAKGNATSQSDVDLKIEKGMVRSLLQLSGLRSELEDALQISVAVLGTQVVAGLNYRFRCKAVDGSEKVMVIYRDLQGNCSVTSAE